MPFQGLTAEVLVKVGGGREGGMGAVEEEKEEEWEGRHNVGRGQQRHYLPW